MDKVLKILISSSFFLFCILCIFLYDNLKFLIIVILIVIIIQREFPSLYVDQRFLIYIIPYNYPIKLLDPIEINNWTNYIINLNKLMPAWINFIEFTSSTNECGMWRINCSNLMTLIFFRVIIRIMKFNGIFLKFASINERLIRYRIIIPYNIHNTSRLFQQINRFNLELSTSRWNLVREDHTNQESLVEVEVDCLSAKYIDDNNGILKWQNRIIRFVKEFE